MRVNEAMVGFFKKVFGGESANKGGDTEGDSAQGQPVSLSKLIELIRGTAAKMIGLVDDPAKARIESPAIPMLAIVSESQDYTSFTDGRPVHAGQIDFVSRVFYMQEMHKTYSATATVCTGAAALIQGTLVNRVCSSRASEKKVVRFGHPSGSIPIEVEVEKREEAFYLRKAALGRTSRRIMEGFAYVPESLFGTR